MGPSSESGLHERGLEYHFASVVVHAWMHASETPRVSTHHPVSDLRRCVAVLVVVVVVVVVVVAHFLIPGGDTSLCCLGGHLKYVHLRDDTVCFGQSPGLLRRG